MPDHAPREGAAQTIYKCSPPPSSTYLRCGDDSARSAGISCAAMRGAWRWLGACGWVPLLATIGSANPLARLDREYWVSLDSTATDQVCVVCVSFYFTILFCRFHRTRAFPKQQMASEEAPIPHAASTHGPEVRACTCCNLISRRLCLNRSK